MLVVMEDKATQTPVISTISQSCQYSNVDTGNSNKNRSASDGHLGMDSPAKHNLQSFDMDANSDIRNLFFPRVDKPSCFGKGDTPVKLPSYRWNHANFSLEETETDDTSSDLLNSFHSSSELYGVNANGCPELARQKNGGFSSLTRMPDNCLRMQNDRTNMNSMPRRAQPDGCSDSVSVINVQTLHRDSKTDVDDHSDRTAVTLTTNERFCQDPIPGQKSENASFSGYSTFVTGCLSAFESFNHFNYYDDISESKTQPFSRHSENDPVNIVCPSCGLSSRDETKTVAQDSIPCCNGKCSVPKPDSVLQFQTHRRSNSEPDYVNLPLCPGTSGSIYELNEVEDVPVVCNDLSRFDSVRQENVQPSQRSDRDSAESVVLSPVSYDRGLLRGSDAAKQQKQHRGGFSESVKVARKSRSLDMFDDSSVCLTHFAKSQTGGFGKSSLGSSGSNQTFSIVQFGIENFNEHRQGIFGKIIPVGNMLSWTKDVISKPMIKTTDKGVKREAPEVFRLIQMYMKDRKTKLTQMQIALEIVHKNCSVIELRDETYVQLCRQTTDNPRQESLMRGWQLMGICLSLFPPSARFWSYLERYICRHLDIRTDESRGFISHFASHCKRLLERTVRCGVKGTLPRVGIGFVEQALKSMFHPSNFGSTLEDIMQGQKHRYPDRRLPWIQTTLSEKILHLKGYRIEGIFRVPGDADEISALRLKCDQWKDSDLNSDPHVLASLLKQWYRELHEPLIPNEFYDECITNCMDEKTAVKIVDLLPPINRLVLSYFIRFLQVFAAEENSKITKMDASNLAMVMAPNCLRCESEDPAVILKNAHKEANFIKTLILNLDTSYMDGMW